MRLLSLIGGMAFVGYTSLCLADDTEVYITPGASLPAGSEPMVMFSLDYRPNLASTACQPIEDCQTLIDEEYLKDTGPYTYFDVLRAALRKVMDPLEGVRVGLMINHNNDNNCAGPDKTGCSNGGYIAMGFAPFVAGDTNGNKERFHAILDAIPLPQGNQSHSYQGKELFFEFYRYLTGQDIYNGHNGWTDFSTTNVENLNVDGAAYAWDPSIESGAQYVSPIAPTAECAKIYTVNSMFQVSNQEDNSDAAIKASVASGGMNLNTNKFDGVIRWLFDADLGNGTYGTVSDIEGVQNVTSYFLIDSDHINNTTVGYAQAGGTGSPLELSENPDELVETLQQIFREILSVSTTFVAASVPVNVFNRAEVLDQVFVALFQVDASARPFWTGNIKKLKIGTIDDVPVLLDSLGAAAIAGTDGRIRQDALTYWTNPATLPAADTAAGEVTGRDGRAVARGGAGQKIPGFVSGGPGLVNGSGSRRLYYDKVGGSGTSLAALDADVATAADLQTSFGAASSAESDALIRYARGLDVDDLDGDSNVTEARPWLIGDPLHSRPLPLNYGARGGYSTTNPAIYVAFGSNDGFMHFIRNTTTGGVESGEEAWAFMPREVMGKVKTLRANAVSEPHPYLIDGAPTAYIEDTNFNGTIEAGERAYLFFGMRRGGRSYYALDVSDPENPSYLWSITGGSGDFAELGYTFSEPTVGRLDWGSGSRPVVVFAGGYDMAKDARAGVPSTADTMGNAIFIVDAEDGTLVWKAVYGNAAASATVYQHPLLEDSIPSTVAAVDSDGDSLLDRIVVGDTGGNVWRADMPDNDRTTWKLALLAKLGRHAAGSSGKVDDRRFFHRPDVVKSKDAAGNFDAVLIGSGDRPDPLDKGGLVDNFLYMLKDRDTSKGPSADVNIEHSALGDVTDNCLQDGSCTTDPDLTYGWKLLLEDAGEKALASPLTVAGIAFFTTYIPSSSSTVPCQPSEGSGRLYALSLQDATSVINYDTTDDDPDQEEGVATTKDDRSRMLRSPGIPPEVVALPGVDLGAESGFGLITPGGDIENPGLVTRWRTFWFLGEDSDL